MNRRGAHQQQHHQHHQHQYRQHRQDSAGLRLPRSVMDLLGLWLLQLLLLGKFTTFLSTCADGRGSAEPPAACVFLITSLFLRNTSRSSSCGGFWSQACTNSSTPTVSVCFRTFADIFAGFASSSPRLTALTGANGTNYRDKRARAPPLMMQKCVCALR